MYTPKLCSSIERNSDTRSALEIRNVATISVNRMIIGYSGIVGVEAAARTYDPVFPVLVLSDDDHGRRIQAPVIRRNTSIVCVSVLA